MQRCKSAIISRLFRAQWGKEKQKNSRAGEIITGSLITYSVIFKFRDKRGHKSLGNLAHQQKCLILHMNYFDSFLPDVKTVVAMSTENAKLMIHEHKCKKMNSIVKAMIKGTTNEKNSFTVFVGRRRRKLNNKVANYSSKLGTFQIYSVLKSPMTEVAETSFLN